jgi:uncharacterized protein (DUF302 family)
MLFELTSGRTLEEIDAALRESAARHSFGIIAVHDLKQKLAEKGVPLAMECRVYEVCNPRQAKAVLEVNGAISTALPCRISVYTDGPVRRIATLLPTALMQAFAAGEAAAAAREVEGVIRQMIQDAA